MDKHYILEGKEVKEVDLMTWAKWLETTNRHVANEKVGDAKVSTVFLGLDYSFGSGPPLLFETMVFGGSLDQEMNRYTTWDEAETGHKAMVDRVKAKSTPAIQNMSFEKLVGMICGIDCGTNPWITIEDVREEILTRFKERSEP